MPEITFLSVARGGVAAAIAQVDTFDASIPARARFPVAFDVQGGVTASPVSVDLQVNSPGDVIGIDPGQVIRTDPKPLTQSREPNFFAAVEFDRPDFPWLFTPARQTASVPDPPDPTTASARLRPWIALVVVRRQEGATLRMDQGQRLPVLEIAAPAVVADELQDLADSWAWAHAQTVGGVDAAEAALDGNPAHNLSRLLCPRKLTPSSPYLACLVPAFRVGALAGLGLPVTAADEQTLAPAWLPSDASARLPVYFHFEFNTGPNGDFEALATLLAPHALTANDVTVPLQIASTGDSRLPADAPDIRLDGALTAGASPPFDNAAYQAALAGIVSQPVPTLAETDPDPVVAPPLYGRWHAAQPAVSPGLTWLADLNLDPRRRIAAGLGTKVVQDQQEQLMASAWEQLGAIEAVNQVLRRAQLAREGGLRAFAKTLEVVSGDNDRALALIGPAAPRIRFGRTTLAATLTQSRVPEGLAAGSLRRLLRPRGALGTRLLARLEGEPPALFDGLNNNRLTLIPPKTDTGLVDGTTIPTGTARGALDDPSEPLPDVRPPNPDDSSDQGTQLRDPGVDVQKFHDGVSALQQFLGSDAGPQPPQPPSERPPVPTGEEGEIGVFQLRPDLTLPPRVLSRIRLRGAPLPERRGVDVLEPILAAPEFPQPMYRALVDLSPEFLVPGLFRVPPNTITLLNTNRKFIESYLTGLNHEMARELLWRGFPTDQRGTYFAQFWDPSTRVPPATTPAERALRKDIVPIHTWPLSSRLGEHAPADPGRPSGDQVVLVIRGELLRRYPNTIIYAAPVVGGQLDERQEELPVFRGTIPPDITFLGFSVTPDDVRARELYFVLQEQPTEPRFGLNATEADQIDPTLPLTTWEDLAWGHFGSARFLDVRTLPSAAALPLPRWGVNSAHMASITLQTPVRVAIFGPDILPAP